MDEQQRKLRRAAAEEFMRSLEQLGEMLDEEDTAEAEASALAGQAQAEADLNGTAPLHLDLDFGPSHRRRPTSEPSNPPTDPA
ncbi:MAG: hypothetical protein AAFN18_21790 [Cyanobacteria bacterium J06554_6]